MSDSKKPVAIHSTVSLLWIGLQVFWIRRYIEIKWTSELETGNDPYNRPSSIIISRGPRLDWPLTYSYAPVSCLNECLCIACWAACSQDIMLRVLFSQQISPSIQYNLNYIPLFHYSVLYPLLCWAFSPYYTLQVHIFLYSTYSLLP